MQWDGNSFEQEIKACNFFQRYSYVVTGREVDKSDELLVEHIVRLDNLSVDRAIEIMFFSFYASDKPAIYGINIIKPSVDEWFAIEDYVKQYHGVVIPVDKFRYTNYSGTFEERARAFLEFISSLLEKYAKPTLLGAEWPHVEFDWQG
ncbi:MAG: hypothetical protein F6K11_29460, partial [Leptolyngbya sp. SIO3F4]|nr:hypothetical protein [Leptolyngbya sp. SIO3F4]